MWHRRSRCTCGKDRIEPVGELPPQAYSAFLDFGWSTDPSKPIGGDIGFRPGVFTDFNTYTKYSWRFMGQGMFRIQATPTINLRGGVVYIDRNDLKLLPAFGILWTPNAQTRFDIFFPRPMLSQYLTTAGNRTSGGTWARNTAAVPGRSVKQDPGNSQRRRHQRHPRESGAGIRPIGRVAARTTHRLLRSRLGDRPRSRICLRRPTKADLKDSFMLRAGWNY